ncbi:hypothetical protein E2320_004922 [Naja naja]|nr:hypothetical protein E2320_004922 [Naja naja]
MANSDSLGIAEMVKRVAEQQNSQASEIQKSKEVLTQMQAQLQDLEIQRDSAVAERKAMERQRYFSEEALAAARAHCEDLEAQIAALHSENVMLTREVDALQGDLEMKVLENRPYCEKMAAHRKRFEEAESKLPFVVELARKRATVQQLMEKKEELLASLQEGEEEATVGQVQLQRKRSEAVLKRLRCQVNNLELERRQGRLKMQQLEGEAEELRKLLQATDE